MKSHQHSPKYSSSGRFFGLSRVMCTPTNEAEEDADDGSKCEGQRKEFKDIVVANAVQTVRNIKFKKCDLVRVRAFKKKVESNPRIEIKELVAKAHKKWNLIGAFREQYKRINDYCTKLLKTHPGSSVYPKVIRDCMYALMSGILCPHAISCINFKGFDLESYMDDCYKKDAYLKCYQ
ncbi:hypothetical protein Ahy_A08g040773 [Arachis hypogaea]|uniref:Uncharacterized protein n=1 Tax=Arachis hypogaea TaxID=3818 RepID=A0A445C0A2_ARAHY|nr:hypothetical protein Ahy_A08g040773 [Arachis hypogaea]